MEHGDVVLWFLAPTDQNPAKAIHPTMRPLHYVAPGPAPRLAFHLLGLFSLGRDVGGKAELCDDLPHFVIGIALVQTQVLGCRAAGVRALDRYTQQRFFGKLHVRAVGPVHGQAQGDAVALDQQAALDALLGAVGGVFPGLFPPRGVPWSCTRPCSARTSRCPSNNRTPAALPSTSPRRRRPGPTPGSDHGRWSPGKRSWHPGPSTGSPCGAQRRWRPCRPGRGYAASRPQRDGCSRVWGSASGSPP